MVKVLAIGNSFSDDARTFIPQIAAASGADIVIGNLYIGGCSLERHDQNISTDAPAYDYSKTGAPSRCASVREALEEENWDFVTMQQVSHSSGLYETYQPYLGRLSDYIKRYAPQAEQLIHETWAYEQNSDHNGFVTYDRDQFKMYMALKNAYDQAALSLGGVRVIPSGDAFQIARANPLFDVERGGRSLNRDGFHASLTHGRCLIGLVWVETLTGLDMRENSFVPSLHDHPDLTPSDEEMRVLRNAAHTAVAARLVRR